MSAGTLKHSEIGLITVAVVDTSKYRNGVGLGPRGVGSGPTGVELGPSTVVSPDIVTLENVTVAGGNCTVTGEPTGVLNVGGVVIEKTATIPARFVVTETVHVLP